jgi:hypothetical protein
METALAPLYDRGALALEQACKLIAEAKNVDDLRTLRDKAQAVVLYLRQSKAALIAMNDAAEVKVRAERRLGELYEEIPKQPRGGDVKSMSHDATLIPPKLEDIGIDRRDGHRWQKLSSIPQDIFDNFISERRQSDEEITTAGLLRFANGSRPANWSSESVEWYTPQKYIDSARTVMGGIDLDPASSETANEVVGADEFFSQSENGLTKQWLGRIWLNPPYGEIDGVSSAGVWGKYLIDQHRIGNTKQAVLLVNAVTDRSWFQQFWDFPICFTDHRIEFYTPNGQPRSPVSGNAFVYLGDKITRFAEIFNEFGAVVMRVKP